MTITYVIPGTTLLDQLAPTALDGLAPVDANDNCVPTSIAEGLHILTGRAFDGDELHDAVYGAGYLGAQSAAKYVAYCASQGVDLAAHNDTQAGLIATIHAEVSAGHPVVLTMPSQRGTAPADPVHPSGSTHVGVAVGVGPGEIRVMNPWHAFYQDQSDAWWQARLCYGQVWTMQKASATVTNTPGSPTPFFGLNYTADAQVWHCPSTGFDVGHGFLTLYENIKGPQGQVATQILGLPKSNEYPDGALTKQDFERARLVYDPAKSDPWMITFDPVYADLEAGVAAAAQVSGLQSQLASAQANLAAAQQQRDALSAQLQQAQTAAQSAQSQLQQAQAQLAADAAQIAQLQQQLAAAQQQPQPAPAPTPTPAPVPTPVANPAPTTPAAAAALLVQLIYAEAAATVKAASTPA